MTPALNAMAVALASNPEDTTEPYMPTPLAIETLCPVPPSWIAVESIVLKTP